MDLINCVVLKTIRRAHEGSVCLFLCWVSKLSTLVSPISVPVQELVVILFLRLTRCLAVTVSSFYGFMYLCLSVTFWSLSVSLSVYRPVNCLSLDNHVIATGGNDGFVFIRNTVSDINSYVCTFIRTHTQYAYIYPRTHTYT